MAQLASDAYTAYEHGLRQLLEKVGRDHPRYPEALAYEQRLRENIGQARRYGDTENRRATRAEVVDGLNKLALAELGTSFNELCGSAAVPPGGATARQIPLQRPPRATHFTGRDQELERLVEALQPGQAVTLCGPGGVGKTALAAEAIWTLAPGDDPPDRFPDGLFFHTFYNQPEAGLALEALARAYGEEPRPSPAAAAQRALAGRTALLVLDGAENADDLGAVLAVRGGCGVLVTSRRRQDALAGWEDVRPLPDPQAVALLQAWGGAYAADETAARRICELVGGLPLAVRLAGRYLAQRQEGAADYLEWLEETPLVALHHGQRQRDSVPLLLALSLEQVSEAARAGFSVMGVLALAPFSREAVAAALEVSPAEAGRGLGELVDYGLLLREEGRYQASHALAHTYARRRLPVADEVKGRLAAYYEALAREANKLLGTEAEQEGLSRFEADRLNILAAHRFLCRTRSPDLLRLLCQLHVALSEYYDRGGRWSERTSMLEQAVSALHAAGFDAQHTLGELEIQLAFAYRRQMSNLQIPLEHLRSGLGRISLDKLSLHLSPAELYRKLGDLYRVRGEFEQALTHYQKAEELLPPAGEANEQGKLLSSLAEAQYRVGDLKRALQTARQSLKLQLTERDTYEIVQSHRILADVHLTRGEIEEAALSIDEACKRFEEIDQAFNPLMGWILRTQGDVRFLQSAPQSALACYERALEIFKKGHVDTGSAIVLKNLGLWELAHGDLQMALEGLDEAVAMARSVAGAGYLLAWTLLARYQGGLLAAYTLSEHASNYRPEQRDQLGQYVAANDDVQAEFIELVNGNEDLAVLWEHFNYATERLVLPSVGIANSVFADEDHNPLYTLDYARSGAFPLAQIHLNQCIDSGIRERLVQEAQDHSIRLMCHAPDPWQRNLVAEPEIAAHAHAVLSNTRDKWVVYHFDEEQKSLEHAFNFAQEIVRAGLVPCIENYHKLKGREQAYKNYRRYKELFQIIAAHELPTYAVLDIPRAFHTELGLSVSEASELIVDVFRHLVDLDVPILLHLIDSRTPEQERKHWCPLGTGVIPYSDLFRKMFALPARVEAVIFEYEDREYPLKSRPFLEQSIRARVSMPHPELSVRWLV